MKRARRRPLFSRTVAMLVSIAVCACVAAPISAPASDAIGSIDPLQTATRIEAIVPRTTIAATQAQIATKAFKAPLVPDSAIVKPALAAIAFKSFPTIDPKTQQFVPEDATIVGPDNKPIHAGVYWSGVNAIEKDLNSRGQTLRDGKLSYDLGRLKGSTQAELLSTFRITSGGPPIPRIGKLVSLQSVRALLPKVTRDDIVVLDTASIATPRPPIVIPTYAASATPTPKPTAAATPAPDPKTLPLGYKSEGRAPLSPLPNDVDSMDFGSGSLPSKSGTVSIGGDYAKAYVNTSVSGQQTPAGNMAVMGKMIAGGYLFSAGGDIASASVSMSNTQGSIDVEAAGSTIYAMSQDLPYNDGFDQSGTLFKIDAPFQLGPFYIEFDAELDGDVGVSLQIDGGASERAQGIAPAATITPHVNLSGTFGASIGVGIADIVSVSVEVYGSIDFANVDVPIVLTAGYSLQSYTKGTAATPKNIYACRPVFSYGLSAQVHYTFLSGSLGVKIKGCVIFCATIFNATIATWSGSQGEKTLVQVTGTKPGTIYSDLPEYGYANQSDWKFSKDDTTGMPKACHSFYTLLGESLP